jgi:hypothetical protein|tara:strand:- start:59 stop:499 length:441 start_codon:yes stop_codon:yes gene_type:complete
MKNTKKKFNALDYVNQMNHLYSNGPRSTDQRTIEQLENLKLWSQNPEAYAKKLEEFVRSEDPVPRERKNVLVKKPKKIKPTEPVKINFNLPPTLTAGLWSNIKNSSIYKLLDNPKVMGVELGHEGIMEAINLLQSSGLLKKGGIVK